MTTAEESIAYLLEHPDGISHHFKDLSTEKRNRLVQLYRLVWTGKHLPIRRAKVIRPTGSARCQAIQTPDECWVVETSAFAVLQAPGTIMIRQENIDCFDDLIRRHSGDGNMFELVRNVNDPDFDEVEVDDEAMESTETSSQSVPLFTSDTFNNPASASISEVSATDADRSDTSKNAMSMDKTDQRIVSPPPAAFPNPFEAKVLRERRRRHGVVVTGQPGIGKSVQSLLILILRLHAHLPTIWQDSDTSATLFTNEGVFQLSFDNVTLATLTSFGDYFPPCTWLLFDSFNLETERWPKLSHTGIFTVQSSSPRAKRFAWTSKTNMSMWYMRPFTLAELIMANQWQETPQEEIKLKEFYERFAPSARMAYQHADSLQEFQAKVEDTLREMEYSILRKMATDASRHQIDDDVSQSILRFDPDTRRRAIVSLPSPFVSDMIVQQVIQGDANKLRDWFSLFIGAFSSRRTAGWILDSAFSRSLLRRGQWPVFELTEEETQMRSYWRSILPIPATSPSYIIFNSRTQSVDVCSAPSDDQPLIMPTQFYDTNAILSLTPNMCYYHPIERNQGTFDGFIWTGYTRGLAIVFQVTVSESHAVKAKGFNWLLSLPGVKEAWYVAVTPADIEINFPVEKGVVRESRIIKRYHIRMNMEDLG